MPETMHPPTLQIAVVRLLRCRKTHWYYTGDGWTDNPSHAKTYPDEIEAVRACVENNLSDIELVLRVPGGAADVFSIPVR